MEVKPGYKQTEVGVIPEDWDVIVLGAIGKFKNGLNKDSAAFGHGSPFVNLMDVFGVNTISTSEHLGLVACTNAERSLYDLKRGDVVFVRSSVKPSGVGLTVVIENDLPETVFSGFLIRFRDNGFIDLGYKRHCFYSGKFRNTVIASSSVSANTNINQDNLKRLKIPLPPTPAEQEAIAEALSDADALIESLEQLLIKKRLIKQGAMQELLTGKKRLPGFQVKPGYKQTEVGMIPEDWDIRALKDLAPVATGNTPPTQDLSNYGDEFLFVSPVDIGSFKYIWRTEKMLSKKGFSIARSFPAGAILFVCIGSTIGKCGIAPVALTSNQQINAIFPSDKVTSEYLYYSLVIAAPRIKSLAGEQAVPIVNKNQFSETMLPLPSDISEQEAISNVLSDMDTEIEELETKISKAHQIKQGMMQELLTGRTRLTRLQIDHQKIVKLIPRVQPEQIAKVKEVQHALKTSGDEIERMLNELGIK
jgi:type I restriction enzyme S subunit